MPYPTARAYLRGDATSYRTVEEKHTAIQQAFTNKLYGFMMQLDASQPNVLVGHVHVRGVSVHSLYKIGESEDVIFEPGNLPTNWSYIAYGHIHKPQAISPSAAHIRYAGSIERMDVAERDDEKSVVLVDVVDRQPAATRLLPLESTPIHAVEILDPDAEISRLAETYPDAERALVAYTLHWEPGRHEREALAREVQRIFPRWYARRFVAAGHEAQTTETAPSLERAHDVSQTAREYVRANAPDALRDALLTAVDALLAEEAGG
jgi:exonuclease SbcD